MTETKFYAGNRFGLFIDLRSMSDNNPHGSGLRVSAQENRAEAGRRGSADLHHISVGCCSDQSSNHDNIYFFIDIIVFENRPPPPPKKKSLKRGAERSDFR